MKIKAATFNTLHCMNYPHYLETGKSVIDFDSVAAQIKDMGADICVLNEMRNESAVGGKDQTAEVAERLGYFYYFAKAINIKGGGEYGNAIVSRYPISSVHTYPISLHEDCRADSPRYEDRVLIRAEINISGSTVTVLGSHFGLSKAEQERALEIILELVGEIKTPLILAGDFNVTPKNSIIKILASHLYDISQDLVQNEPTFIGDVGNDSNRGEKIDYIFSRDITVLSTAIVKDTCSDHRPMYVELEI